MVSEFLQGSLPVRCLGNGVPDGPDHGAVVSRFSSLSSAVTTRVSTSTLMVSPRLWREGGEGSHVPRHRVRSRRRRCRCGLRRNG